MFSNLSLKLTKQIGDTSTLFKHFRIGTLLTNRNKLKWQKNTLTCSSKDDLEDPIRGHFIKKLLVSLITSFISFNLISGFRDKRNFKYL